MAERRHDDSGFTDGQLAVIEKLIYDNLPCATNKVCKEVTELKEAIKKVDNRTWIILAAIIVSAIINIALKF